jgi:hypothetical protein
MSDSFIHELPIKYFYQNIKTMNVRLEMGRILYNAVLREGLNKYKLMKESRLWKEALEMGRSKERTKIFQELRKTYKFSDYDFQKFAIQTKNNCFIKDHLDTHVAQKIATRCFRAVDEYLRNKRGKPRFKKEGSLSSLEGKSNKTGIRFKNNIIEWKKLKLIPIFSNDEVEKHALNCKIKFCRLIRRKIKGNDLLFIQLVLEGKPFVKKRASKDVVGLDIGPSTIASVSKKEAFLKLFCEEIEENSQKIKALKRKLERSRRAQHPENYENGTVKKGNLIWSYSKTYLKTKNELSKLYSILKQQRKRAHGALANKILSIGSHIKCEKLSYKGFQKRFGKSIQMRAPALFLNVLRRKAENAGGKVEEFSTTTTALSQVCHQCEKKKKKKLSQRWHNCNCGVRAQRDLYSAFLACYVKENKLDIRKAKEAFPGVYPLLEQAMSRLNETAIGKQRLASFGLSQSQSGSLVKNRSGLDEAKDVVGIKSESFRESNSIAMRTPLL